MKISKTGSVRDIATTDELIKQIMIIENSFPKAQIQIESSKYNRFGEPFENNGFHYDIRIGWEDEE